MYFSPSCPPYFSTFGAFVFKFFRILDYSTFPFAPNTSHSHQGACTSPPPTLHNCKNYKFQTQNFLIPIYFYYWNEILLAYKDFAFYMDVFINVINKRWEAGSVGCRRGRGLDLVMATHAFAICATPPFKRVILLFFVHLLSHTCPSSSLSFSRFWPWVQSTPSS